jgi:cytochrome c5
VKKLIQKIVAQKKLGILLIALFGVVACVAAYTLMGVYHGIQKMAENANETVTYFPPYPAVNTEGRDAAEVKRGEYLAKAGDCMACHTETAKKDKAKSFAGGLPMYTPFGTIYSPNITPDKETGIGNWTEEQFIKAMREGIAPQGHYYYPAFPYLYFNKVSTEDLKALKAYLDSIPAVNQKNRDNEMVFPFNIRFLQLGWRLLFFNPENTGKFEENKEQSPEWNRGAYLIEGLGHCAMCHSPSHHILTEDISLGAPIRKFDLTGAKVQGFLAPNITQKNLENVSLQEIVEVFTKDKMIGGGKIEGPMLEVNRDSLRHLSQNDLVSIATYLKAVQSESPPKPKGAAAGKAIYDTYCSGCHTTGAGGAPKYGDAMGWTPVLKQGMDKVYFNAIHGINGMPAKGTCLSCTDDEIKQSVNYMIESTKKGATGPIIMTHPKPLTMAEGKQVYEARCSVCHSSGFNNAPKPGVKSEWTKIIDAGFLKTLHNVVTGQAGHPPHGGCDTCNDAEIKAAVKYMMQESSTDKDYTLW